MKPLPSRGSFRRRFAVGFLVVVTAWFVATTIHSVLQAIRNGTRFPVLTAVGAATAFVVVWRQIVAWHKDSDPSDSEDTPRPSLENKSPSD